MKIFQTIRKNHATVGICQTQKAAHEKVVVTLSLYGLTFASSVIFLFHDADTFLDYSNNMYITTGQAMIFIVCTIVTFKMVELFRFIDNLEGLINQSKLNTTYYFHAYSNILYFSIM